MADNVTTQTTNLATIPNNTVISTEEVTTLNGSAVSAQQAQRMILALRTADGTAVDLPGDSANGLDSDVTRIASGASADIGAVADAEATGNGSIIAILKRIRTLLGGALTVTLPTGAATAANQVTLITQTDGIEGLLTTIDADTGTIAGAVAGTEMQVDIVAALPAGTNNIGDVDVLSLPALPAGTNNIGDVDVLTLPALPAGTNNIGDVDIASIAAGDNNIGNVDVVTLPALPAGTNNIGDVDIASIAAGDNNIGNVDVVTLPALPAGTNNIGDVDVLTLPALPAGTNNIGDVDVLTLPAITGTVTANAGTGTFTTKELRAATSAVTSVNDTATSTTLLASNANRLGATVYNDSTVDLYLKLGATASTSSFTVKMAAGGYYEVPFGYTGIIDGIWSSDASGKALMTEVTA